MSELTWFAAGFLVGIFLGYQQKMLLELTSKFRSLPAPPKVGVTKGSYKMPDEQPPDNTRPADKHAGVVNPKSPRRLENEATERMRKASVRWGISEEE